jgi:hypothetical protein
VRLRALKHQFVTRCWLSQRELGITTGYLSVERRDVAASVAIALGLGFRTASHEPINRPNQRLATLLLPRVCYEAVPVFLKASQVGFQQPKYSLGFACVRARRPQADYEALLPFQKASRFGDVLINRAKVIFETHAFFEPRALSCLIDA